VVLLFSLWQGAVKKEVTCTANHASYIAQQEQIGRDAAKAAQEKNDENYKIFKKQAAVVAKLTERAVFAERKLRERPPVRPDGSEVSRTTCDSKGTSTAAGEFVPLEEYRALEGRSFRDTDRCTLLQQAVGELAAKGLLRLE
jgi:hypothetical protein